MADQNKAPESVNEPKEVTLSDKLDEARELINKVKAETKVARDMREKEATNSQKAAKREAEEAEKKRMESEKAAKALAEQRLAYLDYAENYRKKLREQKEKADAQKTKAKTKRELELQAQREAEEREQAEVLAKELAEIAARGAKADELLGKVETERKAEEERLEAEKRALLEKQEAEAKAKAEALKKAEAERAAREEKARKAAAEAEKIDMTVNVSDEGADTAKAKSDNVELDGRIYPVDAFNTLMEERAVAMRALDEQARAYENELERLRQAQLNQRLGELAKISAERSEAFRLLAEEEAKYQKEIAELQARRAQAEKAYSEQRGILDKAIGEYDARSEELESARNTVHNFATGVAGAVSGVSVSAPVGVQSADLAAIVEAERAAAEARVAKAKAEAELKYEKEKNAELARYSQERLASEAKIASLEKEVALKTAQVEEEIRKLAEARIEAERHAATEKVKESKTEEEIAPVIHVVNAGTKVAAPAPASAGTVNVVLSEDSPKLAAITASQLPKFLKDAKHNEEKLEREYKHLSATATATKADKVLLVVNKLGTKRELIESLCDDLTACRYAGAKKKVTSRVKAQLDANVQEYNALVNEYRDLTGHTLTYAQTDMSDAIVKGEKYSLLPTITVRREIVAKDGGKVPKKIKEPTQLKVDTVVGGVHQKEESKAATAPEEEEVVVALPTEEKLALSGVAIANKDIPKYLKKQKKNEKKLYEKLSVLSDTKPQSTEENVILIVERLGTERELVESLSKDLKLAARSGDKKKTKAYKKELKNALVGYNRITEEYHNLTGDSLTSADVNIPEKIVAGEKYTALPVISYRKDTVQPDGYVDTASATAGAAYDVISDKDRRKLEKHGAIGATPLTGLSKREAKALMQKEREALVAEADALDEKAKADLEASKQAKADAKGKKRAERNALREQAAELEADSKNAKALAKEKRADAKQLKNLKAYEKYLSEKHSEEKLVAKTEAVRTGEVGVKEYEQKLSKKEKKALLKEAETKKKQGKSGEALYSASLAGLSKKEIKKRMADEREALVAEADNLEEKAKADLAASKQAKADAKGKKRQEKQALREQADQLNKKSAEEKALAKEKRNQAKLLKNQKAYEAYLTEKGAKAEAEKAKTVDDEQYAAYLVAKEKLAAKKAEADSKYKASKKSKKAARKQMKSERLALLEESRNYDLKAKESAKRAKEEERLAKKSKKDERDAHKAQAAQLKAQADAETKRAKESKETAKQLKSVKAFNKYNDEKYAKESARLESAKKVVDSKINTVTPEVKAKKEADTRAKSTAIAFDKKEALAIAKAQSAKDELVVSRRYDEEMRGVEKAIEQENLKFGKRSGKAKGTHENNKRTLKRLANEAKRALKLEAADNKRYYSVVNTDMSKAKFPKRANVDKAFELRVQLEALLNERDRLNSKLVALYDSSESDTGKSNLTEKRSDVAMKSSKKAHNKQRKLAAQIDALHVTVEEKKKIYDAMNEVTRLEGEIADANYRIKNEKVTGKAKREAKKQIAKCNKEKKAALKKLKYLKDVAFRKAGKHKEETNKQVFSVVVLLLIVALGVCVYFFREPIMEFVYSLIASFGGK